MAWQPIYIHKCVSVKEEDDADAYLAPVRHTTAFVREAAELSCP